MKKLTSWLWKIYFFMIIMVVLLLFCRGNFYRATNFTDRKQYIYKFILYYIRNYIFCIYYWIKRVYLQKKIFKSWIMDVYILHDIS